MNDKTNSPDLGELDEAISEIQTMLETAYYPIDLALDYFIETKAPEKSNQFHYDQTRALIRGGLEFVRQAQGVAEHLIESLR